MVQTLDLNVLDDEQRAAVTAPLDGAALVVAGPGAGKTRVLTHRAAWLIERGVPPNRIALVTFTKRAAGEMEQRLYALTPQSGDVAVSTIHSLGYRLLREVWRAQGTVPFEVLLSPTTHLSGLLKPKSPMYPDGMGISGVDVGVAASTIALYKDKLDQRESWLQRSWRSSPLSLQMTFANMKTLIELYQRELQTRHQIDFEDMYVQLWESWRESPGLAKQHQAAFDHVLVDEFQDTSYGQFTVLRHLAKDNLFAVGDCSQSLYSWRGAVPQYMLEYTTYYPNSTTYMVSTNYRSTPKIVELTQNLIANDTARISMLLHAYRTEDGTVHWTTPDDMDEEAAEVVAWIGRQHAAGVPYREIAALYRTGWYNAVLEMHLLRAGIPYKVIGGTGFFGRQSVMDILAYLQIAADPTSNDAREALLRIFNTPRRFLGRSYKEELQAVYLDTAGTQNSVLELASHAATKPHERRAVGEINRIFHSTPAMMPPCPGVPGHTAIATVRRLTGYDRWFLEHMGSDPEAESVEWLDMLEDLTQQMTVAEVLSHAEEMRRTAKGEDADAVTLSTVHRSKGMEWQAVAVLGVVDGIMPHARGDLGEERRIAYVGMTRAKDHLLVTSPEWVRGKPREVSPYIYEAGLEG